MNPACHTLLPFLPCRKPSLQAGGPSATAPQSRRSGRRCAAHFGPLSDADAQSDAQLEALLARGALDDASYDPWGQARAQGSHVGRRKAVGRCGADGRALRQRRADQLPASGELAGVSVSAGLRGRVTHDPFPRSNVCLETRQISAAGHASPF